MPLGKNKSKIKNSNVYFREKDFYDRAGAY